MRTWRSASVAETREIGRALAAELAPDGALLLVGELGAGKTVLVQGLAAGLGIDPERVQSPTFTLLAEHAGLRGTLRHFDLYRLEPGEVAAAGFEELLLGPGVKAVEWAERLPFTVPGALVLRLARGAGDEREIGELGAAPVS
jgi:tRNA threonylcarbamoyladenosine biosynthesis protein TsaE